jgi:hypothetical protein
MTATFLNRPFNFLADKKNPLGLFKPYTQNGKVYELLGYFHILSGKELNAPIFGNLTSTGYRSTVKWISGIANDGSLEEKFIGDSVKKYEAQIKNFGLDLKDIYCFQGNGGVTFLFKIHRQPISFRTVVTNCGKQAIWDFINANENVPEILSENLLAKTMAESSKSNQEKKSFWNQKINKESFAVILHQNTKTTPSWVNCLKRLEKEEEKVIVEEVTFFDLNSDYEEVGQRLHLDIFEMQKKIISQAKRKGGFVDFTYENITYKIPKLPLMIWATKYSANKVRDLSYAKTEFGNDTWYAVCPESLKTTDDARIHSDWWIGSGFPFEIYNLYNDQYKHIAFNNSLGAFALGIIGKNTLEDIVVLAGKNLKSSTGNVVIYPESLESFNEDDIIVLSSGGVEFDSYIKKSCKNGKGGVILEVGNRAAHLNIVSNELNNKGFGFRLILLPNASELLIEAKTATIDTQKYKIIPNT